jgi:tetratricopeptide (TPR) repeat protein
LPLLPFFAAAILLGRQTAHLELTHVMATGPEWEFTILERILIAGRAVWFYAAKLIWPHPLIFTYPRWQIDSGVWWQYLFPAWFFLLVACLWYLRNRIGRGVLAAVLFFVGTLFPALGFFNVYPMIFSFVADHFQYLASAGLIVLFCATADRHLLGDGGPLSGKGNYFYGAIVLVLAVLSWQQGGIYKNRLTLFNDVIAKNPSSWMAYNNRGAVYYGDQKYDLAATDFQKALDLNPNYAGAYNNRGMMLALNRDFDKALIDFNRSISIEPARPDYLANRGKLHLDMGNLDLALADYDKALQLAPHYVVGHLLRAIVHGMREDYGRALADINEVLRLDPENPDGYANRGLIYYRQGLMEKAVAEFNRSLALNPESSATWFNRALAYVAMGDRERVKENLEQARKRGYPLTDEEVRTIMSQVGRD